MIDFKSVIQDEMGYLEVKQGGSSMSEFYFYESERKEQCLEMIFAAVDLWPGDDDKIQAIIDLCNELAGQGIS